MTLEIRETYAFALGNSGSVTEAIAKLEELLALSGPTPERLDLLGGRYKRLFMNAKDELLDSAIDAYQRGMELDLNQYYCSSNLPRLYRQRKLNDDDVRADIVAKVVLAACERAEKLGLADEWFKQTLLGAAFDARMREGRETGCGIQKQTRRALEDCEHARRSRTEHKSGRRQKYEGPPDRHFGAAENRGHLKSSCGDRSDF
jgi:tetratricopeptide (TPR) repeat protein